MAVMASIARLALFYTATFLLAEASGEDGKIVNGTAAGPGEFPFVVSLRRAKSGRHSCGATLLNPYWVLTAAHCVRGSSPEQIDLQYGSQMLARNSSQVARVAAIFVHPRYEPEDKYVNDIALLQLAQSVALSKFVQPVRLPEPRQVTPGNASAVLAGWGLNATGGVVQQHLQKVKLQVFSDTECSERHQTQLHDSQICAGLPEGGKGQCSGDSGGPLLLTDSDTQVGIVSWSIKPCARPPFPGVFTEVSAYVDWIVETVNSCSPPSSLWVGQLIVGRSPPSLSS
ncbi:trypsin-1 [Drosophila mauritiana]|uniref:Trypsin-1 n=1 Tax=Drosophila mauritiana TaxID=7226 RepID=A0A6P8KNU0_DROMA|nr:trypsin-1 [Drosophila mauritiana]